ncbi:MAG: hypothetical protein KDI47_09085 [Gammaproteobacteria bacterium]|nr:hypothetical protein [Gammaproteobacteria bacterium]MCB1861871.1 hypothetical protein [Gammaproteobacteria bacterium]MCB1870533.1 hypothetical protein [Gammaproteobacteria bacterium]MCB1903246.1 hypothetical protein [Gammaproteobacteria bacterium]
MGASIRATMPFGQKRKGRASQTVSTTGSVAGERVEIEPIDAYWEPVNYLESDPKIPSQLHAKVIINGCPMHFEAYRVGPDGEVCDRKQKSAIDCMKVALRDDQSWRTIEYQGCPYVVVAIPYGQSF